MLLQKRKIVNMYQQLTNAISFVLTSCFVMSSVIDAETTSEGSILTFSCPSDSTPMWMRWKNTDKVMEGLAVGEKKTSRFKDHRFGLISCIHASLKEALSVRRSVRRSFGPSVCPSVCPSVTKCYFRWK